MPWVTLKAWLALAAQRQRARNVAAINRRNREQAEETNRR